MYYQSFIQYIFFLTLSQSLASIQHINLTTKSVYRGEFNKVLQPRRIKAPQEKCALSGLAFFQISYNIWTIAVSLKIIENRCKQKYKQIKVVGALYR